VLKVLTINADSKTVHGNLTDNFFPSSRT
jgi:hypothetical protein